MSVITFTGENFDSEVLQSDAPVLVDFWATWCGPCRMMAPIVDQVAAGNPDVKVGKVNIDEQTDLAMRYGVMSIPTLIVFEKGQLKEKAVGARPKAAILKMLGK